MSYQISLEKMQVKASEPVVEYFLSDVKGEPIAMNALLGRRLRWHYLGEIRCLACDRSSKKSFNQGYCYPCFKKLARCDMCIMKPETCHYHLGTCREPEWADRHCMQQHYVYLANASGVKVGITRQDQLPTRWIDQGAIQALPIYKVKNRYQAGLIEVCLGQELKDKTNWRSMLKGEVTNVDLSAIRDDVHGRFADEIENINRQFGEDSCQVLADAPTALDYPVERYPDKITSYNFDKDAMFEDVLMGIKGQYLIFEKGVINLRKFGAYQVTLDIVD